MYYVSTRNKEDRRTAAEAIAQGLAADGGLLTPEVFPKLSQNALETMKDMSYQQRAVYVMNSYLDDFTASELSAYADKAYGPDKFDVKEVAPVRAVDGNTYCLELWHGPTCAFKDMALQMLPHLLSASLVKNQEDKTVCILVATSGDTGKAALEGFRDVDKTRILVFYPKDGVSAIQELQMVTQEGENVGVCAVVGNFDDAQTGVKRLFSDEALRKQLADRGFFLSSANSINWGRVLPQIVYYISAYCDLMREGKIQKGEALNVCVPTGNFGNILAAYYAKEMGVPMGKLICASNPNNVLTDFLHTGVYDRNRAFYNTMSPSMDILISSNLERLLFDLSGQNDAEVRGYMEPLNADRAVSGERRRSRKSFRPVLPPAAATTGRPPRSSPRCGRTTVTSSIPTPQWPSMCWSSTGPGRGMTAPPWWSPPPAPSSSVTACLARSGCDASWPQGTGILIDQLGARSPAWHGAGAPGRPEGQGRSASRPERLPRSTWWTRCWRCCAEWRCIPSVTPTCPWGQAHGCVRRRLGGLCGQAAGPGFPVVGPEDTVVLCGDMSWGMSLEEARADFAFLDALPGRKLLLKGNHDYWWNTASKMNRFFAENGFHYPAHSPQQLPPLRGDRPVRHPGLVL